MEGDILIYFVDLVPLVYMVFLIYLLKPVFLVALAFLMYLTLNFRKQENLLVLN